MKKKLLFISTVLLSACSVGPSIDYRATTHVMGSSQSSCPSRMSIEKRQNIDNVVRIRVAHAGSPVRNDISQFGSCIKSLLDGPASTSAVPRGRVVTDITLTKFETVQHRGYCRSYIDATIQFAGHSVPRTNSRTVSISEAGASSNAAEKKVVGRFVRLLTRMPEYTHLCELARAQTMAAKASEKRSSPPLKKQRVRESMHIETIAIMGLLDETNVLQPGIRKNLESVMLARIGGKREFKYIDRTNSTAEKDRLKHREIRRSHDLSVDRKYRVELGKKIAADALVFCTVSRGTASSIVFSCELLHLERDVGIAAAIVQSDNSPQNMKTAIEQGLDQLYYQYLQKR